MNKTEEKNHFNSPSIATIFLCIFSQHRQLKWLQ